MTTFDKSKKIKSTIFAVAYLVIAAALILGLVIDFIDGYSILSVCGNSAEAVKANAVVCTVLIICSAVAAVLSAVLLIIKTCKNTGFKADVAKSVIAAVAFVAFCVGYPVLLSVQFRILASVGKITAIFVLNIIFPLLFATLSVFDNMEMLTKVFFDKASYKEITFTTYIYPVLAVLAIVSFVLPLYSFTYNVFDDNGAVVAQTFYIEILSLYGGNIVNALLNHRAALLLLTCTVLPLVIALFNCGVSSARNNGYAKKYVVMKTLRLISCLAFAVIFIYCIPSIFNLQGQLLADIKGFAEDAVYYSNVSTGIAYWAMLIVPVLAMLCALFDGIKEYIEIGDRLIITSKTGKARLSIAKQLLVVGYSVSLLLILLALSLPYASYGAESGVNLYAYLTLYADGGASGGIPSPNYVVCYALAVMVLSAVSIILTLIGANCKTVKVWEVCVRAVVLTSVTVLFAIMFSAIGDYRLVFMQTLGNSGTVMYASGEFLTIACIAAFAIIWIDCLLYVYNVIWKNRSNLRGVSKNK